MTDITPKIKSIPKNIAVFVITLLVPPFVAATTGAIVLHMPIKNMK